MIVVSLDFQQWAFCIKDKNLDKGQLGVKLQLVSESLAADIQE